MTKKNTTLLALALLLTPQRSAAITNEQLVLIGGGFGLAGAGFYAGYLTVSQSKELKERSEKVEEYIKTLEGVLQSVKVVDNAHPTKLAAAGARRILKKLN